MEKLFARFLAFSIFIAMIFMSSDDEEFSEFSFDDFTKVDQVQ
jgi:hypothetical protein